MGPGDRFKVKVCPGIQFGVYLLRWPYNYTIGINLFKVNFELGFGLPYTDPDFPK